MKEFLLISVILHFLVYGVFILLKVFGDGRGDAGLALAAYTFPLIILLEVLSILSGIAGIAGFFTLKNQ